MGWWLFLTVRWTMEGWDRRAAEVRGVFRGRDVGASRAWRAAAFSDTAERRAMGTRKLCTRPIGGCRSGWRFARWWMKWYVFPDWIC
jgi:hypothetical protein